MKRLPSDEEIRQRIWNQKSKHDRMLFAFAYLILGRVSEYSGKYAFQRRNMFLVELEGEESVLFAVKTAKRKGKIRPVASPLDTQYEPWIRDIVDYIDSSPPFPFLLHDNTETSKKYAMDKAKEMLDKLEWPMIDYTRTKLVTYNKDMVIHKRFGDKGFPEFLVELSDGTRYWTESESVVRTSLKILPRWKPATSHVLRKRRSLTLTMDYKFDGFDLATIGGWTEKTQVEAMPGAIKHYLFLDIENAEENLSLLKDMALRYFDKLLVPYR